MGDTSFQPTLPARGATHRRRWSPDSRDISTHAPRTGSDNTAILASAIERQFQPTLPARGATGGQHIIRKRRDPISTHAPRTGSDTSCISYSPAKNYFNPRSPHGERPDSISWEEEVVAFQPTLPARGATQVCRGMSRSPQISTHAPRTGSDLNLVGHICQHHDFNPRSPHGERRPLPLQFRQNPRHFNPHSPHGERP